MSELRFNRRGVGGTSSAFATLAVLGDIAAFVLFAALGRGQHNESGGAGDSLLTAMPFIVAWLAVATARQSYRYDPTANVAAVARATCLNWLLAWPCALAIRAGIQHRGIALSFDIVALVANGLFLSVWRVGLQTAMRRSAKRV